ncbi:MAG: ABC transporter ATP-binding protein [Pseudomonadota bacterium]
MTHPETIQSGDADFFPAGVGANASGLDVKNLSVSYKDKVVLRDISISSFRPGDVTILIGPNGAGKTTLLRAIAGLIPAQGSVEYGSNALSSLPVKARSDILTYLPQTPIGELEMTVLETLIDGALIRGSKSRADVEQMALVLLQKLEMLSFALTPLSRLSGGQRQMAGFAQMAMDLPPVLLLDEPVNALDLRRQEQVMGLIKDFARSGRTVVVVLHDLSLAARWADRLIALSGGEIVADGAPHVALSADLLRNLYGINADIRPDTEGILRINVTGLAS